MTDLSPRMYGGVLFPMILMSTISLLSLSLIGIFFFLTMLCKAIHFETEDRSQNSSYPHSFTTHMVKYLLSVRWNIITYFVIFNFVHY